MQQPLNVFLRRGWNSQSTVVFISIIFASALSTGCLKKLAVNSLADTLSEGSASIYASDDDPKLVGAALPFALKTIETLLQEVPNHEGLLLSAASGFVQYTHAYVLQPALESEDRDLEYTRQEKQRAKKLFLRAYRYGLRALEVAAPGISKQLEKNADQAVSPLEKKDVPALYWTAAALGSAISVAKNDMALIGQLNYVEAMMRRALALNESWQDGAIHEFFIIHYAGQPEPGSLQEAGAHFQRALELNQNRSVSPFVTYAEAVCIKQQNRKYFNELLTQALQFDVDQYPENRLSNLFSQQKAERLLKNIDNLFFVEEDFQEESLAGEKK